MSKLNRKQIIACVAILAIGVLVLLFAARPLAQWGLSEMMSVGMIVGSIGVLTNWGRSTRRNG